MRLVIYRIEKLRNRINRGSAAREVSSLAFSFAILDLIRPEKVGVRVGHL
jgi:hypothetical protein